MAGCMNRAVDRLVRYEGSFWNGRANMVAVLLHCCIAVLLAPLTKPVVVSSTVALVLLPPQKFATSCQLKNSQLWNFFCFALQHVPKLICNRFLPHFFQFTFLLSRCHASNRPGE
jgi:hypothetical protein